MTATSTGTVKRAPLYNLQLGERLVLADYIDQTQLDTALAFQQQHGGLLGHALVQLGILSEQTLERFFHQDPAALSGERMVETGLITPTQLAAALRFQSEQGGRLGNAIIALGFAEQRAVDTFYSMENRKAPLRIGEILVEAGLITPDQRDEALLFQRNSGGQLGDILISLGYVDEASFCKALATKLQMGRVGSRIDYEQARKLPYEVAISLGVILIHVRQDAYVLATRDPLTEEALVQLKAYFDKPIEQVLASQSELEYFWEQVYQYEESRDSLYQLLEQQPENSALVTWTRRQRVVALTLLAGLLILIAFNYQLAFLLINISVQLLYGIFTLVKCYLLILGLTKRNPIRFTPKQIRDIDERELPVYTVLVPIYKEKEIIGQLVKNLTRLDYPHHKLDIRILLEDDDTETAHALEAMDLPSYFTLIAVPDTQPRTKPKACNYGLIRARGDYVVIYDAEDLPEPDQLKKAYLAFKQLPDSYVCVQSKLNYYNSTQNLLTRLFTQEYSTWFDSMLVGVMAADMPIPLGGTSNHFKTHILRQIGAWDPFNVTEDADLGVRLNKLNYKTAIIDSHTWEEANSTTGGWIRQRTHWSKGYMQTWLVHMRHPIKLFRTLGFKSFLGYQTLILGSIITPLINPLLWILLILWFALEPDIIARLFPGMLYMLAALLLIGGNFLFAYANLIGTYMTVRESEEAGRKDIPYSVILSSLLLPIYWVLMSVASYRALIQLIFRPFYWEKTQHGLAPPPELDGVTSTSKGVES